MSVIKTSDLPYRTRRTIKPAQMDADRCPSRDVLVEILEDAHHAPTHGLTQPWRFHVFSDDARSRLADALATLYDRITPTPRDDKRAKLRTNPLTAPVTITVAAHIDPTGKISELDELCATACAVQNLLLSAHQRGLATFWATPPVACSPEFAAWLGLDPATHRAMGLVFLGHPKTDPPAPPPRVPLADRVVFHTT